MAAEPKPDQAPHTPRDRHHLDQRQQLQVFLDVLGLGTSSRRDRVDLARQAADESFKNLATCLGISRSRLSHWLDANAASMTPMDGLKLASLASHLGVSVAWLRGESLINEIPTGVVRAMDLGCAIGVMAAVQLQAAVTVQRCSPAFLDTLTYGQFGDVVPIAGAYPMRLNPETAASWQGLVQRVPFIPPEAVALFATHLEVLASGDLVPNDTLLGPCALSVYAACGWAWDWAEKTIVHAGPATADHRLALHLRERLAAPRQRMEAASYVAQLHAASDPASATGVPAGTTLPPASPRPARTTPGR